MDHDSQQKGESKILHELKIIASIKKRKEI